MQSDKLNENAPAHSTNAPQPATDIPHEDVSKKQSDAQKQNPVSTQVKQGDAVTLTQVDTCTYVLLVSACRLLCLSPNGAFGPSS